ncbi:hypothetical protein, partial [Pseudomonas viridiflava]|uniref:hypothetical protein n=1 Tax=Pseudomonas viridiflava TaxID=33069 RepID=UPI0019825080
FGRSHQEIQGAKVTKCVRAKASFQGFSEKDYTTKREQGEVFLRSDTLIEQSKPGGGFIWRDRV